MTTRRDFLRGCLAGGAAAAATVVPVTAPSKARVDPSGRVITGMGAGRSLRGEGCETRRDLWDRARNTSRWGRW